MLIFGGKDFDRNQFRPREDLLYWNLAGKNTRIWKSNFADIYAGALLLHRTNSPLFFVQIEPSQNGTQNHVVVEFTRIAILKLAVNVLHVGLIGGV